MKIYVLKLTTIYAEEFAVFYGNYQEVLETYDEAMDDYENGDTVEILMNSGHKTVLMSDDIESIFVDRVLHTV